MTALESRKQLLLLESELNRAQLLKDLELVKDEAQRIAAQAQALGALAGSATKILAFVGEAKEIFAGTAGNKKSGRVAQFFNLLRGADAGASLWERLRSCWH